MEALKFHFRLICPSKFPLAQAQSDAFNFYLYKAVRNADKYIIASSIISPELLRNGMLSLKTYPSTQIVICTSPNESQVYLCTPRTRIKQLYLTVYLLDNVPNFILMFFLF